ncbi:hypothetical protein [Salipiger mucosus]|uniref:PH domain-containing protein n=1 Tax=Salipiger mucosus DSM 16094 TaxID=1123237 RepID=S9RRY4_9RHOB|nr:hypothetical protein [Salipiger mucosus]EPX76724.1 hypothetical protein Salmuc_04119 [Salipiger mucosus DSM 16094]
MTDAAAGPGATPRATFAPDRDTYVRSHVTLAALAMAGAMLVLWLAGVPHVWTGAVGGLAAVAVRGWYLMDEELAHTWELTDAGLHGPALRYVALEDIAKLRSIGSAVQIVTRGGDKHLIKFQPDPAATVARIEAHRPAGDAP